MNWKNSFNDIARKGFLGECSTEEMLDNLTKCITDEVWNEIVRILSAYKSNNKEN